MGIVAVLSLALTLGAAAPQDIFEQVAVHGSMTVRAALDLVAEQTGVRFAGCAALPGETRFPLDFAAPLPAALRALGRRTGVLITRLGLYDYLVVPAPQIPPAAPASVAAEGLTVVVLDARYPLRVESRVELDEPRRLVLDLRVEAESDIEVASFHSFDLEAFELDAGGTLRPIVNLCGAPDPARRRIGGLVGVPFQPPSEQWSGQRGTLRGTMLRYEQIEPVTFEFVPGAEANAVERGGVRAVLADEERRGDLWRADVEIHRVAAIGEEEPWASAALRGSDGKLYRPREMTFAPLPDDPEGATVGFLQRLFFDLSEEVEPGLLYDQVVERRRPWKRVPFAVEGIGIPSLAEAAGTEVGRR